MCRPRHCQDLRPCATDAKPPSGVEPRRYRGHDGAERVARREGLPPPRLRSVLTPVRTNGGSPERQDPRGKSSAEAGRLPSSECSSEQRGICRLTPKHRRARKPDQRRGSNPDATFVATGVATLREGVAGVFEPREHAGLPQHDHHIVDARAMT